MSSPPLADPSVVLTPGASMADYQRYIQELEDLKGWDDVDLVHTCFLMGEEVGELFKAVRRVNRMFEQAEADNPDRQARIDHVGEELVDVLNYLLAVANRLDIDVEKAFVAKNTRNQARTWS